MVVNCCWFGILHDAVGLMRRDAEGGVPYSYMGIIGNFENIYVSSQ